MTDPEIESPPVLLSDADMAHFVVKGYHVCHPKFDEGLNERIATRLDALAENPGDEIMEAVPQLWKVLEHPVVVGVLVSLLGENSELNSHKHWHCRRDNTSAMNWHQDSTNNRSKKIGCLLGMYYPRAVTVDMGPTIIVPGTHFRNAPTDRMATYTNIRGQVALVVDAGTVAFTHYDIWHSASANRSGIDRHMVKFLFNRTSDNKAPTWNHDPATLNHLRDWNNKERQDVNNILSFSNPLNVSQSDNYKERVIRRQCWDHLMGTKAN